MATAGQIATRFYNSCNNVACSSFMSGKWLCALQWLADLSSVTVLEDALQQAAIKPNVPFNYVHGPRSCSARTAQELCSVARRLASLLLQSPTDLDSDQFASVESELLSVTHLNAVRGFLSLVAGEQCLEQEVEQTGVLQALVAFTHRHCSATSSISAGVQSRLLATTFDILQQSTMNLQNAIFADGARCCSMIIDLLQAGVLSVDRMMTTASLFKSVGSGLQLRDLCTGTTRLLECASEHRTFLSLLRCPDRRETVRTFTSKLVSLCHAHMREPLQVAAASLECIVKAHTSVKHAFLEERAVVHLLQLRINPGSSEVPLALHKAIFNLQPLLTASIGTAGHQIAQAMQEEAAMFQAELNRLDQKLQSVLQQVDRGFGRAIESQQRALHDLRCIGKQCQTQLLRSMERACLPVQEALTRAQAFPQLMEDTLACFSHRGPQTVEQGLAPFTLLLQGAVDAAALSCVQTAAAEGSGAVQHALATAHKGLRDMVQTVTSDRVRPMCRNFTCFAVGVTEALSAATLRPEFSNFLRESCAQDFVQLLRLDLKEVASVQNAVARCLSAVASKGGDMVRLIGGLDVWKGVVQDLQCVTKALDVFDSAQLLCFAEAALGHGVDALAQFLPVAELVQGFAHLGKLDFGGMFQSVLKLGFGLDFKNLSVESVLSQLVSIAFGPLAGVCMQQVMSQALK
eukprot:m.4624 g.4624  ORF g.4624 m.4624 type:complete len:688 (-) comp3090_c0_seq1:45-2108(-)